jgi:hypothetical protein
MQRTPSLDQGRRRCLRKRRQAWSPLSSGKELSSMARKISSSPTQEEEQGPYVVVVCGIERRGQAPSDERCVGRAGRRAYYEGCHCPK